MPRITIEHEPDNTTCRCGYQLKRIGEEVSEKLDYTPGAFMVENHVQGKWVCNQCETLTQAPVPAQVIDKGIPTSGLLARAGGKICRPPGLCLSLYQHRVLSG